MSSCFQSLAIPTNDGRKRLDMHKLNGQHYLLDYAVTNWLFHLSQSDLSGDQAPDQMIKMCLSSDLLYWLESWFSMKSRDSWTLREQLLRVQNNAFFRIKAAAQGKRTSCASFVHNWCEAMLELLERYGQPCEEEPSHIHFVDPSSFKEERTEPAFFADFVLHEPPVHMQHLRLDTVSHYHDPGSLRMVRNFSHFPITGQALGLFHVARPRGMVFSTTVACTIPELRCQTLSSGQSLPPISHSAEGGRRYQCEGFSVNEAIDLVAVYYRSFPTVQKNSPVDQKHHIFLYEIPEGWELEESNRRPWCKATVSVSFRSLYWAFCAQPLAFDTDRTLLCPYGRLETSSGLVDKSFSPLTGHNYHSIIPFLKSPESFAGLAFISKPSGEVLFDCLTSNVTRLHNANMSVVVSNTLALSKPVMLCVSPLGRFAVLQEIRGHTPYILLDITKNTAKTLHCSQGIQMAIGSHLTFSADEQCLIAITAPTHRYPHSYVTVWRCLEGEIKCNISIPLEPIIGLSLGRMDEVAYLATRENWIQLDLCSLNIISGYDYMTGFVCKQQVSVSGDCLAIVAHPLRDDERHM